MPVGSGSALLYVEDDDDTRELLAEGLRLVGITVCTAVSGEEALAIVESVRPDMLLSDLALPGMDGCTLLTSIRARPTFASLPAIALSGYGDTTSRGDSLRAGFEKHLVKPVALRDIVAAVLLLHSVAAPNAAAPARALRAILAELNASSPCRFTSLLRFSPDDTLVSWWTYDRDHPGVDPFPLALPVHASYCQLVRDVGAAVVIEDASVDRRVEEHPKRNELACYIGAPLYNTDGSLFGSLCSYDAQPHPFHGNVRRAHVASARRIERLIIQLFHGRSQELATVSATT